ncbi:osmoprotectant transport system permease protein [Actinomadura meyerae]|jgi:osmoprotectant transport system permease protein|uniref:Osmoprotectant transport system permease protein n=1 Tax=Actinomadura meyerae TaxID=240840 RepID=A0A239M617_9ACTN|nr:ABC transporter permease [Actinomadura meyerae]SNT38146.1 osmoprotectant transport system permease protein [Actinomadura meyerae]
MTVTAVPERAGRDEEGRGRAGLLVTPVFLLAVCAALYLYVRGLDLDPIERRAIDRDEIVRQFGQHVGLVAVSTALVLAIAIPLGVLLTRPRLRRLSAPFLALANVGQAVPSIGVLVLLAVTVGIGFRPAVIALILVSALPVLRNTMVGLQGVDRSLIEAGRGIGMSRTAVLLRVELPLAVPVILASVRVAVILNVGSATLAAFTNAGGLGELINTGIALNRTPILLTGSVLTAVLAMAADWLIGLVEHVLRPRGV